MVKDDNIRDCIKEVMAVLELEESIPLRILYNGNNIKVIYKCIRDSNRVVKEDKIKGFNIKYIRYNSVIDVLTMLDDIVGIEQTIIF